MATRLTAVTLDLDLAITSLMSIFVCKWTFDAADKLEFVLVSHLLEHLALAQTVLRSLLVTVLGAGQTGLELELCLGVGTIIGPPRRCRSVVTGVLDGVRHKGCASDDDGFGLGSRGLVFGNVIICFVLKLF